MNKLRTKDLTLQRAKGKVLFIDIETSLAEVYTFHIGRKVSLTHDQIKKPSRVICVSYMAEGWAKPKTLYWDRNQNDVEMLKKFTKILNSYPVVVGQNGDNFDIKILQGRLWEEQLPPIQDLVTLDTLKMSRQNMRLMSHKLDYKSKALGRPGKNKMEFQDWKDIQEKVVSPRSKMGPYNKVDVLELREVFWSLVPYCKRLPAPLGQILSGDGSREACPECGDTGVTKHDKRRSRTGLKQRYLCTSCGRVWTDSRVLKEDKK